MADRRTLAEGLKATPAPIATVEKQFVFGSKPPVVAPPATARVPLSTRIRADFAAALKKASLERQLNGVEPNTLQDLLEEAIEPWLRNNGYWDASSS